MKKVYSFRLSEEAKAGIECAAEAGKCSEGEVVEGWALGKVGGVKLPERVKGRLAELAKEMGLSEGAVLEMAVLEYRGGPRVVEVREEVAKTGKRAVFEALKAKIDGGEALDSPVEEKPLSETPVAPFAFMVEGEEHRVMQAGKKLGVYYMSADGAVFTRHLKEGELEQLWEKRIR